MQRGIELALEHANARGVLIEGNSFLRFIDVDFAVLVTSGHSSKIKGPVRWAFQKASAVYRLDQREATDPLESVELLNTKFGRVGLKRSLPVYATSDLPVFVERFKQVHSIRGHDSIARRVQGEKS